MQSSVSYGGGYAQCRHQRGASFLPTQHLLCTPFPVSWSKLLNPFVPQSLHK